MSTPRTDAVAFEPSRLRIQIGGPSEVVYAELARQLERELALKDHDLLLERGKAEKAEKELIEAKKDVEHMNLIDKKGVDWDGLGIYLGII